MNKKNSHEIGSNFSIHNDSSHKSTCTDKIPLLCSVAGANGSGPASSVGASGSNGVGTGNSSNGCSEDGYADNMESMRNDCAAGGTTSKSVVDDLLYNKPSVSGINTSVSGINNTKHWGDSIESIHLECISTISN